MSKRKRILLILLAVGVIALLAYSFRPQPVPVSTETVAKGPLQVTVEQEGRTRVRERYVVSAPLPGFASRLQLEPGDRVEAGQVLLTMRPTPALLLDARSRDQAQARVTQAEAALEAAEARLTAARAAEEYASREFQRAEKLFERKDISEGHFDEARATAIQATAELRAARFAVQAARGELNAAQAAARYYNPAKQTGETEDVAVQSPVRGSVLEVIHKSQSVVQAGQPLLSVGDTRLLEVAVDVLSTHAVQIRPGMRVLFKRWGGPLTLEGRVRVVEPSGFTKVSALGVEEQRVWVISDIVSPFELWSGLGDGYRVDAEFILWENDDVLKVPASALFREGESWSAFVIEEGIAHRRAVELGQRGQLFVEVLEGLRSGEEVIVHPDDSVADGVAVMRRG